MGSQEDDHIPTVYTEDLDNQSDDENLIDDEDEIEEEEEDSTSSGVGEVTIAVAGVPTTSTATVATPTTITPVNISSISPISRSDVVLENQNQKRSIPIDESRRLFQRLWTDEDEIELLQGFLDYNNQRIVNNHHHHDTTAFYDQIKDKLQLEFNKNQLVEKLRRLKKKYRNVLSKISSGKEYVFKTAHDQITFDISSKIWSTESVIVSTPVVVTAADDEEPNNVNANANVNPNLNLTFNLNEQNGNGVVYPNSSEKKVPRSRKRSRSGGVKVEEKVIPQPVFQQPTQPVGVGGSDGLNSVPNLVEETVKSCLLPLFKELVDSSRGGLRGLGSGGMNLDPFALSFGGLMNFSFGDVTDEKWRKQHILELEVCSKRLELVQDQIKSQLEELRR